MPWTYLGNEKDQGPVEEASQDQNQGKWTYLGKQEPSKVPDWMAKFAALPASLVSPEAGQAAQQYFQEPTMAQPQQGEEESLGRNALRTAMQVPAAYGYAKTGAVGPVLDVINEIARRGAIASFDELKADDPNLNREEYDKAVNVASQMTPTYWNALRAIENATDIPLEAKTKLQHQLLEGVLAYNMAPGSMGQRATAGVLAPAASQKLEEMGLPSEVAHFAGPFAGIGLSQMGQSLRPQMPPLGESPMNRPSMPPPLPPEAMASTPPPIPQEARAQTPPPPPQKALAPAPPESLGITPAGETATRISEIKLPEVPLKTQTGKELPVKKGGKDVGYRPVDYPNPTLKEKALSTISKNEFSSPTEGGFELKSQIQENSRQFRKSVTEAYDKSKKLASDISGPVPETAKEVQKIIDQIESINPLKLTPQQKKLLDYSKAVRDRLGSETGYQSVAAQELIEENQNINQVIDHTFEHGDPTKIFFPLKKALEKGVESLIKGTDAEQAWLHAKAKHAEWNDVFNNEHVNPYRKIENKNYESLFDIPANVDAYNSVERALKTNGKKKGSDLAQIAKKKLVEKTLSPYFENPIKSRSPKFREDLNRLKYQVTPDELKKIEYSFREASSRPEYRKGKVTVGKRVVPQMEKAPSQITWQEFAADPETLASIAKGKTAFAKRLIKFGFKKYVTKENIEKAKRMILARNKRE